MTFDLTILPLDMFNGGSPSVSGQMWEIYAFANDHHSNGSSAVSLTMTKGLTSLLPTQMPVFCLNPNLYS